MNINKIKLSGQTYNIQDENATKTVELTQAQYDALAVKDPNTFYIITDATAGDLSNYYTKTEADDLLDTKLDVTAYTPTDLTNYYTKSETSGATEISTALASKADTATTYTKTETDNAITAATSTKQNTLVSGTNIKTINNESLLGSGNITIEGGGSSYTGVSGITINENNEIYYNGFVKTWLTSNHDDRYAVYWFKGDNAKIWINDNKPQRKMNYLRSQFSFGNNYLNSSNIGFALGQENNINGFCAGGLGEENTVNGNWSLGVNYKNKTNNSSEFASGQFNNSVSASTTFGDSGNTLFSVGNGTSESARHNAFEIRQNGDIYITSGGTDIKLQDNLGGGGGGMTEDDELLLSTALVDLNDRKADKSLLGNYQMKGDYVTTNTLNTRLAEYETALDEQNVEEVTAYALNDLNTRFGGLKLTKITESEYAALTTKDENTLYIVVADPS